jgi:lysophospholipase L1-like esterase
MKQDFKMILLAVSVGLILVLLQPLESWRMFSEKTNTIIPQLDTWLEKTFPVAEEEQKFWREVKGTSATYEKIGTLPNYSNLLGIKLEDRDLVVDASGNVVPKAELGKMKPPFKFMIIGSSSMLEGLGPRMEKDLYTIPHMTVIRRGKYSSGLTRPDFYNWNIVSQQLINEHKPQVIITQFGGNDGQTISDSRGRRIPYGAAGWDDVYRQRVDEFMRVISQVRRVYWLELPIAGTPDFTEKFRRMNRIQREVASKYPNIVYVEVWDRFAPNGRYEHVLADDSGRRGVVKAGDGVHLTEHGSKILSSIMLRYVKEDILIE